MEYVTMILENKSYITAKPVYFPLNGAAFVNLAFSLDMVMHYSWVHAHCAANQAPDVGWHKPPWCEKKN